MTNPKIRLELCIRVRCIVDDCQWSQVHDTRKTALADIRRHLAEWHNADDGTAEAMAEHRAQTMPSPFNG